MFDIKNVSCNFFMLFPCDCKTHYESKTFTDKNEFTKFVEDACIAFRTETITEKFPIIAGITKGDPLEDYFVYKFSASDPKEKPSKVKWIGEGTIHSLMMNDTKKKDFFFVVNKEVFIIKSKNIEKIHGLCVDMIERNT